MFEFLRGLFRSKRPAVSSVTVDVEGSHTVMWTTDSDAIAATIIVTVEAIAQSHTGDFTLNLRAIPGTNESFNESEWLAQLVLSDAVNLTGVYQMPQTDGNVQSQYTFRRKDTFSETG